MRKLFLFVLALIAFCFPSVARAQLWSGVLTNSRAVDWSLSGVTGGIPTGWTQCTTGACAAVSSAGASATQAQIQAAWASAPADTYVLLPAGTYNIPCLTLSGISNAVLRGAGANKTLIVTSSTCGGNGINLTSSDGNSYSSINNGPVAVSGTVTLGSSTISLASVPNLKVGNPIMLDQTDTTNDIGAVLVLGTTSAYTGPFTSPGLAGPYSIDGETQNARCPGGQNTPSNCFHQEQMSIVTQCDSVTTIGHVCSSGSNITISPPIGMSNWSTSNTMSAWWGTSPVQYDGIEDLSVNVTAVSGSNGILFNNCSNCWTKGVVVVDTNLYHVQAQYGVFDSVVNSYFFQTQVQQTSSYGVVCNGASNMRIENNIFHAIASPVIWNGSCHAPVVGYNFNTNDFYTASTGYSQNFYGEHSGGVDTSLLEGNITQNFAAADNIHGTGNLSTFFRNVITGTPAQCWSSGSYSSATYIACNNPLVPFQIQSFHRFYNVIGNILGTAGQNTSYLDNGGFSNSYVYSIGLGDGVPNDPNVFNTLMLWGNCDSATGFGSCRFNGSEVPSGLSGSQAAYANPVPSSHTLPASFYYSSQPSWWPSGKPWPIIGPDITGGNLLTCSSGVQTRSLVTAAAQCPSGTTTAYGGSHAYSNPAMDCYQSLGGLANGTGPQLTNFSATTCYGASGSVSISPNSLTFGAVLQASSSAGMTATITNSSGVTITFNAPTFSGTNAGDFSATGCTSGNLADGGTCVTTIVFKPTVSPIATESATMQVNYSGFTGQPVILALSGTSGNSTPPNAPTGVGNTVN
jgi:hypothetical protein